MPGSAFSDLACRSSIKRMAAASMSRTVEARVVDLKFLPLYQQPGMRTSNPKPRVPQGFADFAAGTLVARFSQIEGYRCLSLMRALGVVKCQFALVWLALRSCSQAAISSMRVCLSGMRRSRHWDDRAPISDSARSSQLPCFGV